MNTKQTEALKLALEALEGLWKDGFEGYSAVLHENAINAVRKALAEQPAQQQPDEVTVWKALAMQAEAVIAKFMEHPAQQQEPVAWGIFHFGGKRDRKLYTTCDTREQAIAYIADRHQSDDTNTFRAAPIYTSPPSKPWVGLTDAEQSYLARQYFAEAWAVRAAIGLLQDAEAKLKEKNA